jgi:hypothetical protein
VSKRATAIVIWKNYIIQAFKNQVVMTDMTLTTKIVTSQCPSHRLLFFSEKTTPKNGSTYTMASTKGKNSTSRNYTIWFLLF